MAWEQRGRQLFFYQSQRVNGRRVRRYLGRGEEADQAAAEIERRRQECAAGRAALREDRHDHQEALAPLDHLTRLNDLLLRATLVQAGYHQHACGDWRRRHDKE